MLRFGLTLRIVDAVGYHESRDAISHDWIRWLDQRGVRPILVPNSLSDVAAYVQEMGVDGLIITNGNDVAARANGDYSDTRNLNENRLLDWAVKERKPVFGVCRGLHMINAHFGGSVQPDIRAGSTEVADHVATVHKVAFEAGFSSWLGVPEAKTNSYHRQGFTVPELGDGLTAFALSADGLVEGVVHRVLPILAVQWHPERQSSCMDVDRRIFDGLVTGHAFWKQWLK